MEREVIDYRIELAVANLAQARRDIMSAEVFVMSLLSSSNEYRAHKIGELKREELLKEYRGMLDALDSFESFYDRLRLEQSGFDLEEGV